MRVPDQRNSNCRTFHRRAGGPRRCLGCKPDVTHAPLHRRAAVAVSPKLRQPWSRNPRLPQGHHPWIDASRSPAATPPSRSATITSASRTSTPPRSPTRIAAWATSRGTSACGRSTCLASTRTATPPRSWASALCGRTCCIERSTCPPDGSESRTAKGTGSSTLISTVSTPTSLLSMRRRPNSPGSARPRGPSHGPTSPPVTASRTGSRDTPGRRRCSSGASWPATGSISSAGMRPSSRTRTPTKCVVWPNPCGTWTCGRSASSIPTRGSAAATTGP